MKQNNKFKKNPSVLLISSIVAFLLGISGIYRLLNIQGLSDIGMGVSLAITGFIGGFLVIRKYSLNKNEPTIYFGS